MLSDLWAWDGSNWMQLVSDTAPGARRGALMHWDRADGRLLVSGGRRSTPGIFDPETLRIVGATDTWAWKAGNWSELPEDPTGLGNRLDLVDHPTRGPLLLSDKGLFELDADDTWQSTADGAFDDIRPAHMQAVCTPAGTVIAYTDHVSIDLRKLGISSDRSLIDWFLEPVAGSKTTTADGATWQGLLPNQTYRISPTPDGDG
ncbi:MAG: hypothetical protein ACOCXJ_01275 [Planctomycetota bacterium]